MNTENNINETEITQTLSAAAQDITVGGVPTGAIQAAGRARQRRARFVKAGAAFSVLALGVGGLYVASGRSNEIANSNAGSQTVAPPPSVAASTVPGEPAPGEASESGESESSEVAGMPETIREVMPWNTGFLIVEQPIPMDSQQDAEISFSYTEDGKTFSPIGEPLKDAATSDGMAIVSVVPGATGDSLVVATLAVPVDADGRPQSVESAPLVVQRSSDLVNWETSTTDVALPKSSITDPEIAGKTVVNSFLTSISGSADRWVAVVDSATNVEVEKLLPADVQDAMNADEGGTSYGTTEKGVEIEYTDANGKAVKTTFTWDQLGVPAAVIPQITGGDESTLQSQFVTGEFGQAGQASPSPVDSTWVYGTQIVSTIDGFVLTSPAAVLTSLDGVSWSPVALPDAAAPTTTVDSEESYNFSPSIVLTSQFNDQQALVLHANPGGETTSAYAVSADGGLTDLGPIDAGDMPVGVFSQLFGGRATSSPAMAGFDVESVMPDGADPMSFSVEHEGFTIEMTMAMIDGSTSYTVTETATGNVVAQRSFGVNANGTVDPELQALIEGVDDNGVNMTVFTDEAGNEVVRVPTSDIDDAAEAAYSGLDASGLSESDANQTIWVAGTVDGVNWTATSVTVNLNDDASMLSTTPAVNGNRMLWYSGSDWQILELQP